MSALEPDLEAELAPLKLAVGDVVVHGAHGAGWVVARETRDVGGEVEVAVVLELSRGLSVRLPLGRAEQQLRPVATETELGHVQAILTADAAPKRDSWIQRQRQARGKLGSVVGLAEILRDGADRGAKHPPGSRPSPTERELVKRAHELLTTEIALSRGVEPAEASVWIDDQLTSPAP
ncbi:MAG TPA: CarD family transcriptional regulator [Gaiellaceae bacterium]|nr:CarD family transcriptional regulator [Gaiellaceae bacterium]